MLVCSSGRPLSALLKTNDISRHVSRQAAVKGFGKDSFKGANLFLSTEGRCQEP